MNKRILIKKLSEVFNMNNEFIKVIEAQSLKLRIENARSNSIGSQLACVARARDAYSKSILSDAPFSWKPDFPYENRYNLEQLSEHLIEKSAEFIKSLESFDALTENQMDLSIDLIGHEFLHQGQLVRYIYANNLTMPGTVKGFWHLED